MMGHRLKTIDLNILLCGTLLTGTASFLWNLEIFVGAFLGSFLAFVNWVGFRLLMSKLLTAKNRARFAILLGIKTIAILAIVAVVVLYVPINMLAFIAGLSSLFLGIFTHSIRLAISGGETATKEDF